MKLIIKPISRVSVSKTREQAFIAKIYYKIGNKYPIYLLNSANFLINDDDLEVNTYYLVDGSFERGFAENYFFIKTFTEKIPQKYIDMYKSFMQTVLPFFENVSSEEIDKLLNEYSVSCLYEIADDYKTLDSIKSLNIKQKQTISTYLKKSIVLFKIQEFLSKYGIHNEEIVQNLYHDFFSKEVGWNNLKDILANPYILGRYGVSFGTVDFIAYINNIPYNSIMRYNSLIIKFLESKFSKNGLFSLTLKDFCIQIRQWLSKHSGYQIKHSDELDIDNFNDIMNIMLKSQRLILVSRKTGCKTSLKVEQINDKSKYLIYLNSMFNIETNILSKIQKRIQAPTIVFSEALFNKYLTDFETAEDMQLSKEQKKVLFEALRHKIFAIIGQAGTGKSLLISAYIYVYRRLFKKLNLEKVESKHNFYQQVLCVSPTGKAAQNLNQQIEVLSQTIHKAFNIIPKFSEKERTFDGDCLIIDEASMVDTGLLSNILDHVSSNTRLLFVGDINQLPPIKSGTPFLDLLKSGKIPTMELHTSFRQENVKSLLRLNKYILGQGLFSFDSISESVQFIDAKDDLDIKKKYIGVVKNLAKKFPVADILALSVKKNGILGTQELNQILKQIFNKTFNKKARHLRISDTSYFINDRVLQNVNNYNDKDNPIMNGTFGTIIGFKYRKDMGAKHYKYKMGLKIKFEGIDKLQIYQSPQELESLSLGYALTVHKAQGSEAPIVILPISCHDINMLDQSLIYTAATRAKQKVIFIGNKDLFAKSIKKRDFIQNLGLSLRLNKN